MTVILEKFKEKKQNVVTALREASDALYAAGVRTLIQVFACVVSLTRGSPLLSG